MVLPATGQPVVEPVVKSVVKPVVKSVVEPLDALAFPFSGRCLIEASAGTGKTFTIALLYLRLVLGHRCAPLMPPQILVTTFTEAAADELRERIRARLFEASRVFAADTAALRQQNTDDLLAKLRADFTTPAERHQAVLRLTQAANWMDEAAIFTIHGWSQRMLTEHAFQSRALFEQTVRKNMAPVVELAVQDYWRHFIYALPDEQALAVIAGLGSLDDLIRNLDKLLSRDDAPLCVDGEPIDPDSLDFTRLATQVADVEQRVAEGERSARQAWRDHAERLKTDWAPLMAQLSKTSHKSLVECDDVDLLWQRLDHWAHTGTALSAEDKKFLIQPSYKGKHARPPHPALARFSAWPVIEKSATDERQMLARQLLAHAAFWVRRRVSEIMLQNAEIGFEDMLLNLDQALAGEAGEQLAATLRAQYPVAMIDEFQDTDPLQYRLFDRVFRIDADDSVAPVDNQLNANQSTGTLILIGDPKQSIYRFRGADIASYLAARTATAGRHYTLVDNYRSTPELVDAINFLFQRAEKKPSAAFMQGDETDNPLPFVPVHAKARARQLRRRAPDGSWRSVAALTAWALPLSLSGEAIESAGAFVKRMAEHTADAIASSLNAAFAGTLAFFDADGMAQAPLQPQDIAVLVSDGRQAAAMQRALHEHGVKSVYLSDRHRLFATDEAGDFFRWLQAIAEPQRSDLVRAALGSASFARQWQELDALRHDAQLDEDSARFMTYQQVARQQGVLAAVYQLLHDYDIPARLLAEPMADRSGERRLTNLLHLADWAQQQQSELAGLDALLQRFVQALVHTDDEQELRLEQDEHLVRLITIHSSKGLQYPVVYLPFLPLIRPKDTGKQVATPWRIDGVRGMNLGSFDPASKAEKKEQMAECIRLIYVALTRAESACTLALGPVKFGNVKNPNQRDTGLGYLLDLEDGDGFEASFKAAVADLTTQKSVVVEPPTQTGAYFNAPTEGAPGPARVVRRRVTSRWRMSSFSALTQAVHDSPRVIPETPAQAQWLDEPRTEVPDALLDSLQVNSSQPMPFDAQSLSARVSRLPRGKVFGTLVHGLLERAGALGFANTATTAACLPLVREAAPTFTESEQETLAELVYRTITLPLPTAPSRCLADLIRYQIEQEFWLPVSCARTEAIDQLLCTHLHPGGHRPALTAQQLEGLIKGFIDLVFEADGRYYILDYKTNRLGDAPQDYAPDQLVQAMLDARYDVQLALYQAALHRHLQDRLPGYDPAVHLGGALYVFVRGIDAPGQGVYFAPANPALIDAMDRLLANPAPAAEEDQVMDEVVS